MGTYDPEVEAAFSDAPPADSPAPKYDPEVNAAFSDSESVPHEKSLWEKLHAGGSWNPANWPTGQFVEHQYTALGSQLKAGAGAIHDLVSGKSISEADKRAQKTIQEGTFQPTSPIAQGAVKAYESPVNPMNWPSKATEYAGKAVTAGMGSSWMPEPVRNASVYVGPGIEGAGNVAIGLYGGVKGLGLGEKPPSILGDTAGGSTAAPAGFDSEPLPGGVPKAAIPGRAEVLRRIGLDTARESALTGDKMQAAADYQMTRFNGEPAGIAANAHFEGEKAALANHAENIVQKTGGTLGMDEDSLIARGQKIAAPFDALRQYFADQKKADYAAADERAAGAPTTNLEGTAALLKDPDFTETLLAKDQGGLLGSVQRQFGRFQELNPNGFTPLAAENLRKWLNQVWTPENSATLGKIKGAIDDDVLKGAGEDIYGPARQRVVLEHQLLDNPNGVSKLFDSDPHTSINRSTPFGKIPDTLWQLPAEQFKNVVDTLKSMPDEIQPQAQAALAEIQAHGANKLHAAGTSTQGQWAAPKVSKILQGNSAKFQTAFGDTPELLGDIRDLDSAGRILKTDQSYPGAAAQAANMMKRGMMSHAISRGGGSVGALAGSILGPPGAAAGAAIGEAAGGRIGTSLSEKAALGRWNDKLVPLEQLLKPKE